MTKEIIVFDTNFIWFEKDTNLKTIFSNSMTELIEFIEKNKIKNVIIAIPQVVIDERLCQRQRNFYNFKKSVYDKVDSLKQINIQIDIKKLDELNYMQLLEEETRKFIKDNSIVLINLPEFDSKKIYDRALNKISPFMNDMHGFKDTLIWLSIKKYAEQHQNLNILLLTDDKGFIESSLNKELKENNQILIKKDLIELEEYFDIQHKLQLKLKKYYDEMLSVSKSHLDDIMDYLYTQTFFNRIGRKINRFKYKSMNLIRANKEENNQNKITIAIKLDAFIDDAGSKDPITRTIRNLTDFTHDEPLGQRYLDIFYQIPTEVIIELDLEYDTALNKLIIKNSRDVSEIFKHRWGLDTTTLQ